MVEMEIRNMPRIEESLSYDSNGASVYAKELTSRPVSIAFLTAVGDTPFNLANSANDTGVILPKVPQMFSQSQRVWLLAPYIPASVL